jgi:methionine biosynthesis protein MetW
MGGSLAHRQMLDWVPAGSRVLELGCASGYMGKLLIDAKSCRVTGVEYDAAAAAEARQKGLSVIEGSLEDAALRASLTERYDVVMAADVLEHLRDPATVLEAIKGWLEPGGLAIVSVPNVANWSIRRQLFFRGDFEYQETGILDRTHLRFFTWNTVQALFAEQGWQVADSFVGLWDIPLGKAPLLSWPRGLDSSVSRLEALPTGAGRLAYRGLRACTQALSGAGEGVARAVYRRWPNLCAKQMVFLLRPPDPNALGAA